MAIAAFTLARLAEVREVAPGYQFNSVPDGRRRQITA
jgi:hypothetical protein